MKIRIEHQDYKQIICIVSLESFEEFVEDFQTKKFDYFVDKDLKQIKTHISNYTQLLIDLNSLKDFYDFKLEIDNDLSRLVFEVKDLPKIESIEDSLFSTGFKRKLKDFQLRNLTNLVKKNIGAEFSVPGGGKTSVALSYFSLLRKNNSKLLVICPKNAMLAWDEDLPECFDNSKINILNHKNEERFIRIHENRNININDNLFKDKNFFIITYTQINNFKEQLVEFLIKNDVHLFLDESHRVKLGDEGYFSKSVLSLKDFPSHKLILSGTPITKSINDLSAQLKFLYGYDILDNEIMLRMEDVKVRTTKEELKIKPIKPSKIILPTSEDQTETDNYFNKEIKIISEKNINISEKYEGIKKIIMYKIMLSSNPFLLRRRMYEEGFPSEVIPKDYGAKIYAACEIAREIVSKNEKVIIWSFFRENIEILDELLKDLGSQYIHGGTDTGDISIPGTRENIIKEFKENPSKMVLVANPASAGEGISLHKECHKSIYIDRTFNAAHFLQSRDRIHRLGLPEDVQIIETILEHDNFIDNHVDNNLESKMILMEEALNDYSINPSSKILKSIVDYMSWSNNDLEVGSENYSDKVEVDEIDKIIQDLSDL